MPSSGKKDVDDKKQENELQSHCYLQVAIAGEVQAERIVIELKTTECPLTCRNFSMLCQSTETTSRKRPQPTYRGSEFHRIIDNFMVQAGDFERFDGSGGYSPLISESSSSRTFADENLTGKHDKPGVVSMANRGPNSNGSQFFITLKATNHLDSKHVVFGQVKTGMQTVFRMLEVERENDRPTSLQRITIVDCGVGKGPSEKPSDRASRKKKKKTKKKKSHKCERKSKKDRKRKKHRRHQSSDSDASDEDDSSSSQSSTRHRKKRRK